MRRVLEPSSSTEVQIVLPGQPEKRREQCQGRTQGACHFSQPQLPRGREARAGTRSAEPHGAPGRPSPRGLRQDSARNCPNWLGLGRGNSSSTHPGPRTRTRAATAGSSPTAPKGLFGKLKSITAQVTTPALGSLACSPSLPQPREGHRGGWDRCAQATGARGLQRPRPGGACFSEGRVCHKPPYK